MIHYNGARADKPYIEVDCPAIPRELFESELFGHEKGSFTGASGRKAGLMELAEGEPFSLMRLEIFRSLCKPSCSESSRNVRFVG